MFCTEGFGDNLKDNLFKIILSVQPMKGSDDFVSGFILKPQVY